MQYRYIKNDDGTNRTDFIMKIMADGRKLWIPKDPRNLEWQAYQEWLKQGNPPLPALEGA